jgi:ABC-2 type transport system ATP-binding protein
LSPDNGTVRVFGNDPKKEWSVRREIGIVSDEDEYFPELTIEEFLWWVGKLRSIGDSVYKEQIERYTHAFYIDEHRNHLISSLSHGTRRKVSVTRRRNCMNYLIDQHRYGHRSRKSGKKTIFLIKK